MANTFEATIDDILGSDAEFQAAAQAIESAILASGFLEVAPDTGQANLATFVRPAGGAFQGYRIYRAKDSLAATKPFYLKVEFGVGAVTDRLTMRRTLGTGSNGTGTLTGVVTTAVNVITPTSSGTGFALILGGGGPRSMFMLHYDSGQSSMTCFWSVGRLILQTDGSVGDSVLWDSISTSTSSPIFNSANWTDGALAWASITSGLGSFTPDLGAVIHSGGDINTKLLYQSVVYRSAKTWVFPMLFGKASEFPWTNSADSQFNLNIWGGAHNFLILPPNALSSSGSVHACVLWE